MAKRTTQLESFLGLECGCLVGVPVKEVDVLSRILDLLLERFASQSGLGFKVA